MLHVFAFGYFCLTLQTFVFSVDLVTIKEIIMKKIVWCLMFVVSSFAMSQESDLVLEGERWLAKSTGYVCNAFEETVERTPGHERFNVQFSQLSTDYTLDNVLVKASFDQGGSNCSYSVLLFADNANETVKFVESRAFALNGDSNCLEGKDMLDKQFALNKYLYWGHPHHVSIVVPDEGSASVCGPGATHIAIDFTLSGRVRE